jgi:hypothetical protein
MRSENVQVSGAQADKHTFLRHLQKVRGKMSMREENVIF